MFAYQAFGIEGNDRIHEDEALEYAIEKIRQDKNGIQNEFIKWFYSGNYIKEEIKESEENYYGNS